MNTPFDFAEFQIEEKESVVNEGIQIYAVGIGIKDKTELETLASARGNTYMVQRYGQLSDAADELHRQIRARECIEFGMFVCFFRKTLFCLVTSFNGSDATLL